MKLTIVSLVLGTILLQSCVYDMGNALEKTSSNKNAKTESKNSNTQGDDKKEQNVNNAQCSDVNSDTLKLKWDKDSSSDDITISDDGSTIKWPGNLDSGVIWYPCQAMPILHNGRFEIEFEFSKFHDRQIGIGLMVYPPNWGFYGYLGAGYNAWSYDPTTGDIVTQTESIKGNLPKWIDGINDDENERRITLDVNVKHNTKHYFQFIVQNKETGKIDINPWDKNTIEQLKQKYANDPNLKYIDDKNPSIVIAGCLLGKNQWIRLKSIKKIE